MQFVVVLKTDVDFAVYEECATLKIPTLLGWGVLVSKFENRDYVNVFVAR